MNKQEILGHIGYLETFDCNCKSWDCYDCYCAGEAQKEIDELKKTLQDIDEECLGGHGEGEL